MKISYVITAKSRNDSKLKDLIVSIKDQYLGGWEREIIVVTQGTSESAKAIGIRRSTGDYICILASDNLFIDRFTSLRILTFLQSSGLVGGYPAFYHWSKDDNRLNRYFSLIGANDPLAFCLGKCDRLSQDHREPTVDARVLSFRREVPTLGDNCFFIRRDFILNANLDAYYHIDVCEDLRKKGLFTYAEVHDAIWHRSADGIISFFLKRYRFGAQHAFNRDRRWHLVTKRDYLRVALICFSACTFIGPTWRAFKGWLKVKDPAWFLHPIMLLITVLTYGSLLINRTAIVSFRWLYARMGGQRA